MADSIVRLKVDSNQYEAKLKQAAQGILDLERACRSCGGVMNTLEDENRDYILSLGQMETASKSAKGQLREMTDTLNSLTTVYRRMSQEEQQSEFGQAFSKAIGEITQRAGDIRDAMDDVQASIKRTASDTRAFDQMAGGVQAVTTSFQLLQGGAKLLGIEIGDNVEVLAKLQAAMAVTSGLQQAQNLIQKESALMMGVSAVQAKALAAAQALFGKQTRIAMIAQAGFNAVAKANPYALIIGAIASAVTVMKVFSTTSKEAAKSQDELTDSMKQAQKMAEIWNNTIQSSFSQMRTKYDELQRAWQSLTSEHQRNQWIKENQQKLADLGLEVKNVKQAEDVFNGNTEAVVQSFVRRAQAAARVAQLTELYRKQIELLDKKQQTSAAIAADAAHQGRSAQAGDLVPEGWRDSRYGQVDREGKWRFTEQGAKLYSGTDTSTAQSVVKIDVELEANQQEIDKVKKAIENDFKDAGGVVTTVNPPSTPKPTADKKDERTEYQLNEEKIKKLNQEYVGATDERKKVIQGEIAVLRQRNEEIQRLIDESNGIKAAPAGSFAALTQELSDLQEKQKLVTTSGEWKDYETKIKAVQDRIKELKGEVQDLSSVTTNNIGQYIAGLQSQMGGMTMNSEDFKKSFANLADASAFKNLMETALQNGIDMSQFNTADLWKKIINAEDIPDDTWQSMIDVINEKLKELEIEPITINFQTGGIEKVKKETNDMSKSLTAAGSAISQIGNAFNAIEDPAAKVMGTIAQAIATVASAAAQAMAAKDTTASGWAWIGAAAAITAQMITTIATIKSATAGSYANGGIIPGNSYSGDKLTANVNSGELILNRAQQDSIASQLTQDNLRTSEGGGPIYAQIRGETIYCALNNYLRRSGRGELATWR